MGVRMQNDMKLPPEQRRNYKHAIDGMARVYREEGLRNLFSGADWATGRAILMTIGQLCFYDQIKQTLLASGLFGDNLLTHFTSSLGAVEMLFFFLEDKKNIKTLFSKWLNNFSQGAIATTMTQPLDVLKTRSMNAKPG